MKMMNNIKFYDTSALLEGYNYIFSLREKFVISSITLKELENIKTSSKKSKEQKCSARRVINLIKEHPELCEIYIYNTKMLEPIFNKYLQDTPDMEILACAIDYDKIVRPDEMIFVTNDLSLYNISNLFFGEDSIEQLKIPEPPEYNGYKEFVPTEEQLNDIYSGSQVNYCNLLINEYLILKDNNGEIIDKLCWTENGYRKVGFKTIDSKQLGLIKPVSGDVYQLLALDSLAHNNITMLCGPAGTGKSYLSLGFLFNQLERHRIDKIIIFCNTVATKDAAKLGYYPGERNQKLLDSQIGNFLQSKIGSFDEVNRLVSEEKILLLPMSDIRGYDTSGMNAGVYITEAQNMSVSLMKLALQRIGSDSICIIDGDMDAQVDLEEFEGENNGMRRLSEIFRGQDIYGEIKLQTIHRSKIAEIANKM